MKKSRVLLSGASVAGPALAFWLKCFGFEVTVVETAGGLHRGGQAVDFKGPIHLAALERRSPGAGLQIRARPAKFARPNAGARLFLWP